MYALLAIMSSANLAFTITCSRPDVYIRACGQRIDWVLPTSHFPALLGPFNGCETATIVLRFRDNWTSAYDVPVRLRVRRGLGRALLLSMTGREGLPLLITMTNSSSASPPDGNCQADPCKRGDVMICDENDLKRVGNRNYHKGCEPAPEEG